MSGAGDVNGDGYADVIVAGSGTLKVYVFYGSADGIRTDNPTTLTVSEMGSGFGVLTSIASAGDVNGDGFADVIVGGYNANQVFVYQGSAHGISATASTIFDMLPNGGYGGSVAGLGDLNGDGYDDVLFSPGQCSGFQVYAYPGGMSGVNKMMPLKSWSAPMYDGRSVDCFGSLAR